MLPSADRFAPITPSNLPVRSRARPLRDVDRPRLARVLAAVLGQQPAAVGRPCGRRQARQQSRDSQVRELAHAAAVRAHDAQLVDRRVGSAQALVRVGDPRRAPQRIQAAAVVRDRVRAGAVGVHDEDVHARGQPRESGARVGDLCAVRREARALDLTARERPSRAARHVDRDEPPSCSAPPRAACRPATTSSGPIESPVLTSVRAAPPPAGRTTSDVPLRRYGVTIATLAPSGEISASTPAPIPIAPLPSAFATCTCGCVPARPVT